MEWRIKMKKLVLLALTAFAFMSCTNVEEAQRVLEAQGFNNIEITGYNFLGCGQDDTFRTGFVAIGQNGQKIEGTVCSGIFLKGNTIRF